ncbi:hypothetical protein KVT40_006503 [Elsinoe batatas]|uniref:Arrestin-like N-terminal domain-containing protein n=1 Tax=Elsinoe batatas TaxID=2601811 RepID=A0A8K0PF04_9PEZI|nr:hypothetical protein KVT40_006503 [Elsinoe batatas]
MSSHGAAGTSSKSLSIILTNPQDYYLPQQVIAGVVQLDTVLDTAIASIVIHLKGLARSQARQPTGQTISSFSKEIVLLHRSELLYESKRTQKAASFQWPFRFELNPDPAVSTSVAHIGQNVSLLPSFHFLRSGSNVATDLSVAYLIEAEAVFLSDSPISRTNHKKTCSLPFRLLAAPPADLLDGSDPTIRGGKTQAVVIQTFDLLPDQEKSQVSSARRAARSLFRSKAVPKLTFDFDVSYPTSIQVGHPHPVPFIIGVQARTAADQTTVVPDQRSFYRYSTVFLKHASVKLRIVTDCICPTLRGDLCWADTQEQTMANHTLAETRLPLSSIYSEEKTGNSGSLRSCTDLGRTLGFKFRGESQTTNDATFDASFALLNMARRYYFDWTFIIECANQKLTIKGCSDEIALIPLQVKALVPSKRVSDSSEKSN